MADVDIKTIDEMESLYDGAFVRARASLGVSSFGLQIIQLPAGADFYPAHDEAATGQEEVYVTLRGSGTLRAGDQDYALEPGTLARVAPAVSRQIIPGDDGLQLLAIGGRPGHAYEAPEWSELGAAMPGS